MKNKLKLWDAHPSWEEAEKAWEEGKEEAEKAKKLKTLSRLPSMPGIKETGLKWKSLKWMISQDKERKILKGFLRRPFAHGWAFLRSLFRSKSYTRDGDFFYYGLANKEEFEKKLCDKERLFLVGFSYCHKPFECPSGRFTPHCVHDVESAVCRQCFIGKAVHALPQETEILYIPTVHYIGEKIFELLQERPNKKILFLITACEMTLEMFGDWGNMTGIEGVGVRLGGRICNTMEAFRLSERGIKPGLTVVLEDTQKQFLAWIKKRRES